jgi:hypothetical protein
MNRCARLQLLGPVIVVAGLLASECASRALAHAPSSPVVWYVSEDLLGLFRDSRRLLDADSSIAQSLLLLLISFGLLSMAGYGFLCGRRLVLAVASNLNVIYVSSLLCTGCGWWTAVGGLATMGRPPSSGGLAIGAVLAGTSLLSALASHIAYVYAIRDEASWLPTPTSPTSSWWSLLRSSSMPR